MNFLYINSMIRTVMASSHHALCVGFLLTFTKFILVLKKWL